MKKEVNQLKDMQGDPLLIGKKSSPQPFKSFAFPVFRLFFSSVLSHNMAMNMQLITRSLLTYRLTGSYTILAAMSFAHAIPMLALSLFGGVIADRLPKRKVIIIAELISAAGALGVGLALSMGYLSAERAGSWWILIIASVLHGSVQALMMPSRQAIIPEIVGEEHLMNAVSLNVMGMNALRLFAPAAAGFLIDAVDFEAVFFTMTGLYCLAAFLVKLMPPGNAIASRGRGTFVDIKEGFGYMRKHSFLMFILVFVLFVVILSMPYTILLPIFADDILEVGATGMGLLMSASGIGAVTGSLVLASLPNKKRGLLLLLCSLFMGLVLSGFAFSTSWYLSLGLIVFLGLAQTGMLTLGTTIIQYYVEDEYRGRVMSIFMMEFGLVSFGAFVIGLMAESMGVQWALGSFAMVLALLSLLAISFLPDIRKLD